MHHDYANHNITSLVLLQRIGLITASFLLLNGGLQLWHTGQGFYHPATLLISFVLWGIGIVIGLLAVYQSPPRRSAWLVLISALVAFIINAYLTDYLATPLTTTHTDNEMIGKYALEALKHGQNPYQWNFSDSARVYRDNQANVTPFLDNAYQYRLTYPALPVFVLGLFDMIGLGEVRTVSLIGYLLLLVLVFLHSPEFLRPVILLPLLILKSLAGLSLQGTQDVIWVLLLFAMLLCWNSSWKNGTLRAVWFGLAAAYRQQPWLLAPFLCIVLWYEGGTTRERLQRIAYFAGLSVLVFTVINLPFVIWDWRAWAMGTFEPAYATFNLVGHGVSGLSAVGLVSFPREFYLVLQLTFLAGALLFYWRHPDLVGQGFWIFPGIFFWLYYRGLANYWLYWLPLLLAAMIRPPFSISIPPRRYKPTLAAIAVLTLPVIGLVGYYLAQPAPITVDDYRLTQATFNSERIGQMDITITNHSQRILRPRFTIQYAPVVSAHPWTILAGPESLRPGETGNYVISVENVPVKAFPVEQGAQIVVTDADGSYHLRAIRIIPPKVDPPNSSLGTIDEIIDHPEQYYMALAERYRMERNIDLANQAYLTALSYSSNCLGAYLRFVADELPDNRWSSLLRKVTKTFAESQDRLCLSAGINRTD